MSTKSGKPKLFGYEELVAAVDLPTPLCRELTQAGAALKKAVNPLHMQLFWVPMSVAHVAVLHTGRVREDLVPIVSQLLGETLAEIEPFEIQLKNLHLYEEAREGEDDAKPRAIWVTVEESEQLTTVREKMMAALADMDIHLDESDYKPHVPLALIDDFRNSREFNSAFVEWESHDFGTVPVHTVQLKIATASEGGTQRPFAVAGTMPLKGGVEQTS